MPRSIPPYAQDSGAGRDSGQRDSEPLAARAKRRRASRETVGDVQRPRVREGVGTSLTPHGGNDRLVIRPRPFVIELCIADHNSP